MTQGSLSRLLYVDDSGSPNDGWIVYGWVEVHPAQWRVALRQWLEFRKRLLADYGISVTQELHTTKYANGRERISSSPPARFLDADGGVRWKDLGREVVELCLAEVRDLSAVKVGAVHRQVTDRGGEYHKARGEVYAAFIARLDAEHRERHDYVFIGMDGNGSDLNYFNAHRGIPLDTRHIIEDPMFHDSSRSQWTQIADLVAYAAYMSVARIPDKQHTWDWYRDYLAVRDPAGGPQSI